MNKTVISGLVILFLLVGGLGFWIFNATNTNNFQSEIEAKREKVIPAPTIDKEFLESSELDDKKIKGAIPINVDTLNLGRQDPFANI